MRVPSAWAFTIRISNIILANCAVHEFVGSKASLVAVQQLLCNWRRSGKSLRKTNSGVEATAFHFRHLPFRHRPPRPNPHNPRPTARSPLPRFCALALFGRRHHECMHGLYMVGIRKPAQDRLPRCEQISRTLFANYLRRPSTIPCEHPCALSALPKEPKSSWPSSRGEQT
jgi:hypothetical protein